MSSTLSRRAAMAAFLVAVVSTGLVAQPDVIVGDITGPCNYNAQSGYDAFSMGTTSCNLGNAPLIWLQNTNEHPVMGGALYRYDPANHGRLTMVGMSWVKHGFGALQQNICGGCQPYPNTSALGIQCSDPYGACQNGQQSGLGPRSEVNPSSGDFPYPPSNPSWSGGTERRLRVALADLDTASTYISEAQYIHWQDALGGVDDNNASYRVSEVTGGPTNYTLAFTGPTVREDAAIKAWAVLDSGVVLQSAQVPGPDGGLFNLGVKRIDNGDGTWHFEYCVQNLNCHDSAAGFSVQFAPGVTITNQGFYAPETHSNEIYDNNAWMASTASNGAVWMVDQMFAQNPNSNALRWSTAFSFWFDSTDPDPTGAMLDLYRSSNSAAFPAPTLPDASWQINGTAHLDVDGNAANDPFVGPIEVTLVTGSTHTAHFDGVAGQSYELYLTAGAAVPNGYVTVGEQVVNLNLTDPTFAGYFGTSPSMPAGGISFPFTAGGTLFLAGQLYSANPAHSDGFSLSACTEMTWTPAPRVTVECDGPNSYVNDPDGFWRITHNAATSASITSVVLSFQGATGPANGVFFDTDQGLANGGGRFDQGSTYRNGSDVATGLNYVVSAPYAGSGWIGSNGVGGASFNTVEFQFTGGQFNGNTLGFDADTDPGTQSASDHVGMSVTVILSDSSVLTGTLAIDPTNSDRSFVDLW